jgi:hypothetical protein
MKRLKRFAKKEMAFGLADRMKKLGKKIRLLGGFQSVALI